MACDHPITALRLGIDEDTGKQRIKIKRLHIGESLEDFRNRYGAERVLLLPCGHCSSCKLAKRREWMIRCKCEAEYHQDNCFVTLTYNDFYNDGRLHKDHFQQFIKNLRNNGVKVRYFACGEFGEQSSRPHYHAILFGYFPSDIKFSHKSDSEEAVFTSEQVQSAWKYGLAVVQEFAPAAAGYVAGYTNKKVLDDRGFLMTSRRPGLGFQYLMDHLDEIYKYDLIQGDFGTQKSVRPSRYFDKLAEKELLPFEMPVIREDRLSKADEVRAWLYFVHHFQRDEEMFDYQRYVSNRKISMLRRSL